MDFIDVAPPVALKKEHVHVYHDEQVSDPYHWLRQKDWTQEKGVGDSEILDYLKAENAHADVFFDHYKKRVEDYQNHLKNLMDIDETTFPISNVGYGYFTKNLKGYEYSQHWCKNLKTGEETLLLDENVLAEGHEYFNLVMLKISPNRRYLAYAYDIDGSERLILKIRDLSTNEDLPFELKDVSGNGFVWSACNTHFYFQKIDKNWRSNTVHRGSVVDFSSTLIFNEPDTLNHVSISKTRDNQYLLINSKSATDNIVYVQNLAKEDVMLTSPFGRQKAVLYSLDSQSMNWIMTINDVGPNKRLVCVPYGESIEKSRLLYHDLPIIASVVYNNKIALLTKKDGLPVLLFIDFSEDEQSVAEVVINEKSFTLSLMGNDYNDTYCHVQISGLSKPATDILIDMETLQQDIVHTKNIPDFKSDDYVTDRLWATSYDGVKVPYTIAYKKGIDLRHAPTYLYGYGSYGYPLEPNFRTSFIPLLEDGYVCVLAHIRGGGDLGRSWYEAAKFQTKKKTFEDFIACAEDLILKGYAQKGNIVICGGSAGGMLVGTVMNMRPDLFSGVIAMVPFVDVINTMMDETLPLTPGEFLEWGNPKQKDIYDYMKTYSPYDNVEKKDYPCIYVTAGLNDPRVTYWEPAKWVARLRALKTDNNILLFETEMGAGHGGPSGKIKSLEEIAKRYAFMDYLSKKK